MKALVLISFLVAGSVSAQSVLPPCNPNVVETSWTNCQGTVTWANGFKYVGEFRDGKPHGLGTLTWANGDKYVGQFRDGKRNGQGTFYWLADNQFKGDKYVGEYRDNKRHGQGTLSHANGHKYVGEFRDGKRNGQGTFYWLADDQFKGDKYVGEFKDNKAHGQGTATYASGNKYVGEFRDGKRNGQGTGTYADGSKYVGEWRDDKHHGQGIFIFVDQRPSQEGFWQDNKFVRAERIPDHIAGRTSPAAPPAAQALPAAPAVSSGPPAIEIVPEGPSWIWVRQADESVREFAVAAGERVVFEQMPIYLVLARPEQALVKISGRPVRLARNDSERDLGRFGRSQLIEARSQGSTASPPMAPRAAPNNSSTAAAPAASGPRQAEPPRSTLLLSASASQPDANGVVTLTISTNSDTASLKINGDEAGGRADGRYALKRFAQVGENRFEVVATDRFGNTQKQLVSVLREPADTAVRFAALNPMGVRTRPTADAVAIIIGIQDYRRVPKADFASNDAKVFYDYAIRGLGVRPENVKLLTDDQADDVAILGAFKNWLPLKSRKAKTDIYVFYSGHGYPSDDGASLYFLPHGVDRQFLDRTAIKQSEIISALQAVSPRSVTLFLDACYSGQSRTGETLLAGARPISIQPKASTFPSNFTVLSASAPEQIASSSPDLKHGIFSYFLMKGMEGEADQNKDGAITVQEMQSYLSDSVGRKAMSLSRTQQPQMIGDRSKVLVNR